MSIFKSTFIEEVRGQLKTRQNAIASRKPEAIYQLNSRNAWIKMTSSVDVNGSDALAKKYILQGGVLSDNKLTPGGVGNSYTPYPNRGIRPMPGIISVDIKSKSAYGSLREATVSFSCNSMEQLQDLERLYMRPGYTVLLEWGWLPYLDNNGKLQSNLTDTNTSVISGSFSTMSEVFDDLFQRSRRLSGNYDAIFGKVSNYSWTARPDGGYDCQTTLISVGEVIESLKVNSVPPNIEDIVSGSGLLSLKPSPDKSTLKNSYSLSKLNGLLTELKVFAESKLAEIDKPLGTKSYAGFTESNGEKYDLLAMRIAAKKDAESSSGLDDSIVKSYITLESLVKLMNKHVLLSVVKEDDKGKIKTRQPLASISVESNPNLYDSGSNQPYASGSLLCLAHPYQVSVDINTCIITNEKWGIGKEAISVGEVKANTTKNATGKINTINPSVFTGDILNYLKVFAEAAALKTPKDSAYIQYVTDFYDKVFKTPAGRFENLTLAAQSLAVAAYRAAGNTTSITLTYPPSPPPPVLTTNTISFAEINSKISTLSANLTTLPIEFTSFLNNVDSAVTEAQKQTAEKSKTIPVKVKGHLKLLSDVVKPENLKRFQLNTGYDKDEIGVIGNIYVNINMLQQLASANNVGSDKREIQLYSFLKTVMGKIQESIGNLNNFDIHVDPADGNVGRIIDINTTIPFNERGSLRNKVYEIPLGTIGSIVRSYNLQSQIFPNQSSLISIGAQVKNEGEQGTQNYTLLSFNKGVTDRNLPAKVDPKTSDKVPSIDEKKKSLQANLNILNEYLFPQTAQVQVDKNGVEITSDTSKYKNSLRDVIAYSLGVDRSSSRTSSIIPIQLSLDIDGIGGIIIGNLFKVPEDALPEGYKLKDPNRELVQTVIGLSHKITNNDWVTTIDAYNIILDSEIPGETTSPDPVDIIPEPSNTGNRTIPDPPFAPNGLRYPFDNKFTFVRGIQGGAHGGADLAMGVGNTIYAVDDGKVVNVSDGFVKVNVPAGGTQVAIYHTSGPLQGKSTLYSHLSQRYLNVGAIVKKGDPVGLSGNTGRSDGPHLHFEVIGDDPAKYFPLFS